MNFLEMIFFLCSGQGFFLSFLLLKNKKIQNRLWLSLYFASYSAILINWVMMWHDDVSAPVRSILIYIPFQSLLGVALYLFLQKDVTRQQLVKHLAFPVLVVLWLIPGWAYNLRLVSLPDWYIIAYWKSLPFFAQTTNLTIVVYSYLISKVVRRSMEKKLLYGLAAYFLGYLIYTILSESGLMTDWVDYVVSGIITVSFYFSGYHYLVAYNLRLKKAASRTTVGENPQMLDNIENHLVETKVFLNPNFKLEDLARSIELPIATVSQTIMESKYSNFPELINSYRIEHAKNLLLDGDAKILAVALDSGYNNKVSFIQNFKKIYQLTPTEYRKLHSPELVS